MGGPAASSVSALVSVASADVRGPWLSVMPCAGTPTVATVDPVDEERAEDSGREGGDEGREEGGYQPKRGHAWYVPGAATAKPGSWCVSVSGGSCGTIRV